MRELLHVDLAKTPPERELYGTSVDIRQVISDLTAEHEQQLGPPLRAVAPRPADREVVDVKLLLSVEPRATVREHRLRLRLLLLKRPKHAVDVEDARRPHSLLGDRQRPHGVLDPLEQLRKGDDGWGRQVRGARRRARASSAKLVVGDAQ